MASTVVLYCLLFLLTVSFAAGMRGVVLTIEAPTAMDTTAQVDPKGYLDFESPPQHHFGSVIPEELRRYVMPNYDYGGARGPPSGGHYLEVLDKVVINFPHLQRFGGPRTMKFFAWQWASVDDPNYVKFFQDDRMMAHVTGSFIRQWVYDNNHAYYDNPASNKTTGQGAIYVELNAFFLGNGIGYNRVEVGTTSRGATVDIDNLTYGNYTGKWTGELLEYYKLSE